MEPSTQEADDSDITEEGGIVGLTVLNASKRMPKAVGKVKEE